MPGKIPKVNRIYPISEIPTPKKVKTKTRIKTPQTTISPEQELENKHNMLSQLMYTKLYFLNKGNYKQYKNATITYAEYATKNYEAVKTMPKEKVPKLSVWGLSPLLPFYAIRYARILITDMFRKKTPAEKELAQLAKIEIAKRK